MRYNPIDDPGIRAGAEKPVEENPETEEIVGTINAFTLNFSKIISVLRELFDKFISIFKR